MSENTIKALLDQLAKARIERDAAKNAMKELLDQVRLSAEFQAAEAKAVNAQTIVETLTEKIVTWGKAYYARKQDKHPHPGVEIKIFNAVHYRNRTAAMKWAVERLPNALTLDDKKVIAYASKVGDIPGVIIEDDPRVFIARDLSNVKEKENDDELPEL